MNDSLLPKRMAQIKQIISLHAKNKDIPNISSIQQRFKELESFLPFELMDEAKL